MPDWIRIFIAACFYYSGLVKLSRWWTSRSGHRLTILNYHRASGGDLRRHLLYLRRHYRILHLEKALEELYMPREKGEQGEDRRPLMALTFDDGYYDNYTHILPLACELQIPITIFLIPGYIESAHCFWWLAGEYFTCHAQIEKATIEGHTYYLKHPKERAALAQAIYTRAHNAQSVIERETFLDFVSETLGVTSSVLAGEKLSLPLEWKNVREMMSNPWISFGAHTMNHPILANLTDATEMQFEIEECRTVLERQLGQPVRCFAYPLGKPEHIGEQAPVLVQQAGYNWAVTTIRGFNIPSSNPLLLRRLGVGADQHWLFVASQVTGLWDRFSKVRRLLLKRKEGGTMPDKTDADSRQEMVQINVRQKAFYESLYVDRQADRLCPTQSSNKTTTFWWKLRDKIGELRYAAGVNDYVDDLHREWMRDLQGARVLDLGCSTGNHLSLWIAERCEEYIGIDLSEPAATSLHAKLQERGLTHACAYAQDFLTNSYPDNYFDLINAMAVLHHFKDKVTMLKELQRVLKPGGTIISFDPLMTEPLNRLARFLYRPFQADRDWEWPFSYSTFRLIQQYFQIEAMQGVMGLARLGLPFLLIPGLSGLGHTIGQWGRNFDNKHAQQIGLAFYLCWMVTLKLRKPDE